MIKVTFISDLHNRHVRWWNNMFDRGTLQDYNNTDILVFSGDMSGRGYKTEVKDFVEWFKDQPGTYKVMIAGNHDFFFEQQDDIAIREMIPSNVHYLNDSGVELMGLKFWGSPITPWFHDWAFNRWRCNGQDGVIGGIKQHWDLIPLDTDVLVTHGPPYQVLDLLHPIYRKLGEDWNKGCEDLLARVKEVEPVVHAFGHIHEGYGVRDTVAEGTGKTIFVNASCLNEHYEPVNRPITLNVKGKGWA